MPDILLKVMKNKENLRNCHSKKDPKVIGQRNVMSSMGEISEYKKDIRQKLRKSEKTSVDVS